MTPSKTIGFFGGTFDPIHFGHINLALQLLEIYGLDQVLFCPTFQSPFKTASKPIANPEHRLAMVQAAIAEIEPFAICPFEIEKREPSYTIDTIRHLQKEGIKIRLLLSEDAIATFHLWKEPDALIRLAPPLIGTRAEGAIAGPFADKLLPGLTRTRILEISSTEIRTRLKKKLYCGHLIPSKALDYIQKHRLY